MAKVDYTKVPASQRRVMLRGLAQFLVAVKSEGEMLQVLHRLLTPSEVVMLGRRLHIAGELVRGQSYRTIGHKYNVGIGTIRSIDRWLEEVIQDYDQLREKKDKGQRQPRKTSGLIPLTPRYIHIMWPLALLDLILSSLDTKK
jgi:Trp operon repressor